MLLPDGDLRTGSTDTGSGDRVPADPRHLLGTAKAPPWTVQWPHIVKDDWLRRCPEEPVQLSVVPSLAFQYLLIPVGLCGRRYRRRAGCCGVHRGRDSCWRVHGLRVLVDATRRSA
ncbi:hypothetical protein QFZ23_002335 [Arthrobacter globiformis]|nr:hypothetical protein [Arthrobacter globiformis]